MHHSSPSPHFTRAIVRTPARSLAQGITTADLGAPDYTLALAQHAAYCAALEACGLAITILPAAEEFPDSTFVEDVAVCTPHCAIVTRPGAPSRTGETALIEAALAQHYDTIYHITAPGTLEGGDVMMVGSHYYIGLSDRTNAAGAQQLIGYLAQHGMTGEAVPLGDMLHLKTGLSYLEQGHLLVHPAFAQHPRYAQYTRIHVPPHEAYAANAIWINGQVLVPAHCPETQALVAALGYTVLPVPVTEFQKLDGGLSCLSLRF